MQTTGGDDAAGASASARVKGLLLMSESVRIDLFDDRRRARLDAMLDLGEPVTPEGPGSASLRTRLAEVEVLVTGWGAAPLTVELLDAAPRLRAVVHTGGSVKGLVPAQAWDRGLTITSAAEANAVPVAEFTVGHILLEAKRTARYAEGYRRHRELDGSWRDEIPPVVGFGGVVGIIGLSRAGHRVAELLRPFDLEVLVADPHVADADAARVGARRVALEELMRLSDIVTVHAPALPETYHLLNVRTLGLLRRDAVLINTARGSLIDTDALVERCRAGTLRAVLDVTDPEPLPGDSPLFDIPGITLTPHIAGAMDSETHRLADSALDDIERILDGREPLHRVHKNRLHTMA